MTGGVLGLCLRRLWLSAALCCAWLLRSATPGQSIEAPWPVATYPNGSVVLNALDNGILLVPKEGHAVEVQGDLLVQGVSVLSSLTPPLCQGAHEKLVYNGTAWACVCESSWGGPGCDVYQSTRVCGLLRASSRSSLTSERAAPSCWTTSQTWTYPWWPPPDFPGRRLSSW